MKAYADLEQSRQLAEILPPESADMYYHNRIDISNNFPLPIEWKHGKLLSQEIPCWSLAALLGVLPLEIETHKQTDGYKIYYYVESYMKRMGKEIYLSTERHENLVDACVAMILKLHEQKLL